MFRVQKRERPPKTGGKETAPPERRGESKENDHFAFAHITLRCLLQFDLLSFSDTSWILFDDFGETTREQHHHLREGGKTATPTKGGGKGSTTKKKRRPTNTTQNCSLRSPLLGGADFSLLSLGKFSINKRNQDFLSFKNSSIVKKKEKSRLNFDFFFFLKRWGLYFLIRKTVTSPRESGNDDRQEKQTRTSLWTMWSLSFFFCPSGTSEAFPLKRSLLGDFWESQQHTNSMLPQRNLIGLFFFFFWFGVALLTLGKVHTTQICPLGF